MVVPHDPAYTASFYDQLGEREWARHDASWAARASFRIHCHYLSEFIHENDRVLEAGAGPGRFTIELAKLGARIHVGDISRAQLELNASRVKAAGAEHVVMGRDVLDICNLSQFAMDTFDAVVCYGGPLGYTMDQADGAIAEMIRVVRPGGYVLLSVMSVLGGVRHVLGPILDTGRRLGLDRNEAVFESGDLTRDANGHECHMFRWRELRDLLSRHGQIVVASATNFISVQNDAALDTATEIEREMVLRWEVEACREPGLIEAGTHMLAVLQKAG